MFQSNKNILVISNQDEKNRFKFMVNFMHEELVNQFINYEIIETYKSTIFSLINWNELIENINKSKLYFLTKSNRFIPYLIFFCLNYCK